MLKLWSKALIRIVKSTVRMSAQSAPKGASSDARTGHWMGKGNTTTTTARTANRAVGKKVPMTKDLVNCPENAERTLLKAVILGRRYWFSPPEVFRLVIAAPSYRRPPHSSLKLEALGLYDETVYIGCRIRSSAKWMIFIVTSMEPIVACTLSATRSNSGKAASQ